MLDQELESYIRDFISRNDPKLYELARLFNDICPEVSLGDIFILLDLMQSNREDYSSYSDSVKRLLMQVKLQNADEFAEDRALTINMAQTRKKHNDERIRRAKEEMQARHKATHQRRIAEKTDHIVDRCKVAKYKDDLLVFMDKVSYGFVYKTTDADNVCINILKTQYNLGVIEKGWLVKTLQFTDYSLAQKVREDIVKIVVDPYEDSTSIIIESGELI